MRGPFFFLASLLCLLLALDVAAAQESEDVAEPACTPTEPDMLGPYYEPNAPVRNKTGEGVIIQGFVRGTNCTIIKRAKVEFWQADSEGEYVDSLRATLFANNKGQYKYPSRPIRHWHVKVTAKGYNELITQIYPDSIDVELVEFDFVLIPTEPEEGSERTTREL